MRKIINWLILLCVIFLMITLIANFEFKVESIMVAILLGGFGYWLFNRICDDGGIGEAFRFREKTRKSEPVQKGNLICPKDAHDAVEFLARLVTTIDRLMPYAQNGESAKINLSIWQNDDKKTATLGFWYDKDYSTMRKELLEHYNLEDKFHFTDDGWINYDSKEILHFTPEWVDGMNAQQVITYTFLNSCPYAKVLNASCGIHDGKLSCFFTFGF